MKRQTIKKSIDIDAAPEKVWRVLTEDTFTRAWYHHFSEGTHAITTWEEGSPIAFKDNTGCGMTGRIVTNKPYELLDIEFLGMIGPDGKEDYDSQDAVDAKGGHETYRLENNNGITRLSIASDIGEAYFDMMVPAWDNALEHIRSLATSL